jgi:hypothetical protein
VRDYNADEKIDWHDYYLEALSPVQTVSIKLGALLFTPVSVDRQPGGVYITLFIGLGQKLQDTRAGIQAKADKAEALKAEAHRERLAESQSKLLAVNTDLTEQVSKPTEEIHHHLGIKHS